MTRHHPLLSSLVLLAACAAPAPRGAPATLGESGLERLWIEAFGLE